MPATLSAALDQLEQDLGVQLPGEFRRELADPAVHQAFRSAPLDANPSLSGDDAVADTVATLRQGNRHFRAAARWRRWDDQPLSDVPREVDEAEKPWLHHWLWLGGNFRATRTSSICRATRLRSRCGVTNR